MNHGTILLCIDDTPKAVDRVHGMPLIRGSYYTVRDWNPTVDFNQGVSPGVRLMENRRDQYHDGKLVFPDAEWCCKRFRLAEYSHSESATARQKAPTNA